MSLDVYLDMKGHTATTERRIFIREDGQNKEISRKEWDELHPGIEPVTAEIEDRHVYSANITHNLNRMAKEAGIYMHLWRPEEIGITKASQLIEPLAEGLNALIADPERFEKFNPENGWGTYGGLVGFVKEYLEACQKWPDADVSVWR